MQEKISIRELMENFRQAILSVLPSLQRVGIPFGEASGYDAWDEISGALYKHMVIEVLKFGVHAEEGEFNFPNYEMIYEDYRRFSLIEVFPKGGRQVDKRFVFRCFAGDELKDIECVVLSKEKQKLGADVTFKWLDAGCQFVLAKENDREVETVLEEIQLSE